MCEWMWLPCVADGCGCSLAGQSDGGNSWRGDWKWIGRGGWARECVSVCNVCGEGYVCTAGTGSG